MATAAKALPANVPGDFYVDQTCIDCGACRWIAPGVFNALDDQSRVHAQPENASAVAAALRALVACPTASIGTREKHDLKPVIAGFPEPVAENVYFCGFTAESSFGAAAWLIVRPQGNVMIDTPRFAGNLVKRIEALGGIRHLFLTHRDDVADHAGYTKHFGCTRIMHADDAVASLPEAEWQITGLDPVQVDDELTVIPTPGHSKGSACLHYRNSETGTPFLFTGDHLAYSTRLGHLYAFRDAMWYRWDAQIESMKRLARFDFAHVLPGHGSPWHGTVAEARDQLRLCLDWMPTVA